MEKTLRALWDRVYNVGGAKVADGKDAKKGK